ncbi:permease component of ABC-type sugar transporter [Halobacteroides halobius DSM 5150]|uniref:Permease component of ABC-type sugar transporter n=1 Tax=Halobacteroides halobius (strain ATCC 35273 / DSM 5150 / MD-1) TaxID=748449 RepID=L0K8B2_HALHC|nr:sugar ABC transporter permease [Halobacteroides halobius]AGB41261.1 permease component of ABC-type sugar transporter [Halobacteroides halobius DSM 5150]
MFKNKFQKIIPYLFITPHLFIFSIFLAFPALFGLYISLHRWNLLSAQHPFVGFKNYTRLFNPESFQYQYFWNALGNTFQFVIFSVPILVIIGLILAILVNRNIRGTGILRSIFYTPVILSVTSVTLIWMWMLDTQSGLINYILNLFGVEPIAWLSTTEWAWVSLVVTTVWWTAGHNMLLLLAGLQDIPQHYYEAAEIDGANIWDKFWHITLPCLKPTILFVTVTSTIASFKVFGQPHMMTQGGPGRETEVAIMYIKRVAFANYRIGSAAAMALIVSLFVIVIGVIQFKLLSKDVEY